MGQSFFLNSFTFPIVQHPFNLLPIRANDYLLLYQPTGKNIQSTIFMPLQLVFIRTFNKAMFIKPTRVFILPNFWLILVYINVASGYRNNYQHYKPEVNSYSKLQRAKQHQTINGRSLQNQSYGEAAQF